MPSHPTRVVHATIAVPLAAAYAFTHEPANFPKWAAGMSTSLHRTDRGWVADTPEGEAIVRFSEPNAYGIVDHWVRIAGRPEIHIPFRLIANGDGTEVVLVLYRQPGTRTPLRKTDFNASSAGRRGCLRCPRPAR